MKKVLFLLVSVTVIFSCSNNSISKDGLESIYDLNTYPQKWQLEKMSGSIPNSETEGSDMEWQETYILNDDGTFIKSRIRNNVDTEATGIFVFQELIDGTYLILTHQADNELIGSCSSNPLEEVLWVKSINRIIGTWNWCDGPGSEYKRIE